MKGCYRKAVCVPIFSGLRCLLGDGLLFSEGEEWKMKRKIMSNVFNFDFLRSKIPTIIQICSEILDDI